MGNPIRDPGARFWRKVQKGDGCWLWTGAKTCKGYGRFNLSHSACVRAHRYALEITTGVEVPAGLFVCHRCDNPSCVRPDHLFVGSAADNVADMIAKGRARLGSHMKARTHCPRGHEYTPTNTMKNTSPNGRACRACHNERTRNRARALRRAAA